MQKGAGKEENGKEPNKNNMGIRSWTFNQVYTSLLLTIGEIADVGIFYL
jgi:hypothetical protein